MRSMRSAIFGAPDVCSERTSELPLEVCEGVDVLDGPAAVSRFYASGSVLPSGGWTPASERHKNSCADLVSLVSFQGQLGDWIAAASEKLIRLQRGERPESILAADLDTVTSHIAKACRWDRQATLMGLHSDRPNCDTVTVDMTTGQLIGLHLDSWSSRQGTLGRGGHLRVALNLGPGDRYFLFCPDFALRASFDDAATAFMLASFKRRAQVGAVDTFRLRIRPGQAYVANTDALIHDASTSGLAKPCFSLQLRGESVDSLEVAQSAAVGAPIG